MSATVPIALRTRCAYCRRVYREGVAPETTGACRTCFELQLAALKCNGGPGCGCAAHVFLRGVFEPYPGQLHSPAKPSAEDINRAVAWRVRLWRLKRAASAAWPWLAIAGVLAGYWWAL